MGSEQHETMWRDVVLGAVARGVACGIVRFVEWRGVIWGGHDGGLWCVEFFVIWCLFACR